MDIFFEQIIKKKKTALDLAAVFATYLGGLAVGAVIMFSVIKYMPNFFLLGIMLAVLVFYGAIKLATFFNVEYEYSVTNGSFDIDKIINKSSRKHLISTTVDSFESFSKYDEKKLSGKTFDQKIFAVGDENGDLFCATLRHPKMGRVLVVFEPDRRILENVINALPYQIKLDYKRG